MLFTKRLENLRKRMLSAGLDAVLVSSSSNIRYLSGFSGSESDLVVTKSGAYLLCDSRYTLQAQLECPHCTVLNTGEGIYNLVCGIIYEQSIKRLGFEDRSISFAAASKMSQKISSAELVPVGNLVSDIRIIKDETEIAALKKAAFIADGAFRHALSVIKPGVREIEVAAEIEYYMRKNGAEKPSFDTIVASGENSAKPHGTASEKPIDSGDFIVMDFGCVVDGYCSDITRTVALGNITKTQKSVYSAVLFTQLKMVNSLCSGMPCAQTDTLARNIFSTFSMEKHFTHALGHGVGLDVHEQPTLSRRSDITLCNNMVVTVEPGLYFDGKYGVRIEDTVVMSGGKAYPLTSSPKELIII